MRAAELAILVGVVTPGGRVLIAEFKLGAFQLRSWSKSSNIKQLKDPSPERVGISCCSVRMKGSLKSCLSIVRMTPAGKFTGLYRQAPEEASEWQLKSRPRRDAPTHGEDSFGVVVGS